MKDAFTEVFPWRVTLGTDSPTGWAKYATVYCHKRWAPSTRGNPAQTNGILAFETSEDGGRIADVYKGRLENVHTAEHPDALWLQTQAELGLTKLPPALRERTEESDQIRNRAQMLTDTPRPKNKSTELCRQRWELDSRQRIGDRMRRCGWKWHEIAVECQYSSGHTASELIQAYRRRLMEMNHRLDFEYKYKHLNILHDLSEKLGEKIENDTYHVDDVYALLKVLEREAKLTGIETIKIEHSMVKPEEMTQQQLYERMEQVRIEKQKLLSASITVSPVVKSGPDVDSDGN